VAAAVLTLMVLQVLLQAVLEGLAGAVGAGLLRGAVSREQQTQEAGAVVAQVMAPLVTLAGLAVAVLSF
jgi:hypothetical protein